MATRTETLKTFALLAAASWLGGQFSGGDLPSLHAYSPGQKAQAGSEEPLVAMVRLNSGGDRMVVVDPANWQMTLYSYSANKAVELNAIRDYRYDIMISDFPIPKGESLGSGAPTDVKTAAYKLLKKTDEWKKHFARNGLKRAKKAEVAKELDKFAKGQLKEAAGKTSLHVIGDSTGEQYLCLVDRANERQIVYQVTMDGQLALRSIRRMTWDLRINQITNSKVFGKEKPTVRQIREIVENFEQERDERSATEATDN